MVHKKKLDVPSSSPNVMGDMGGQERKNLLDEVSELDEISVEELNSFYNELNKFYNKNSERKIDHIRFSTENNLEYEQVGPLIIFEKGDVKYEIIWGESFEVSGGVYIEIRSNSVDPIQPPSTEGANFVWENGEIHNSYNPELIRKVIPELIEFVR